MTDEVLFAIIKAERVKLLALVKPTILAGIHARVSEKETAVKTIQQAITESCDNIYIKLQNSH